MEQLQSLRNEYADFKSSEVILMLIELSESMGQIEQQIGLYDNLIAYYSEQPYMPNSEMKIQEALYNKGKTYERMKNY